MYKSLKYELMGSYKYSISIFSAFILGNIYLHYTTDPKAYFLAYENRFIYGDGFIGLFMNLFTFCIIAIILSGIYKLWRDLLTEKGYLSFSIPFKAIDILIPKLLTIVIDVIILIFMLLFFSTFNYAFNAFTKSNLLFSIELIVKVILYIMVLWFSITIGNIFSSTKKISYIVSICFLPIISLLINEIISTLTNTFNWYYVLRQVSVLGVENQYNLSITNILSNLIISTILFFVTSYLINKKVEIL